MRRDAVCDTLRLHVILGASRITRNHRVSRTTQSETDEKTSRISRGNHLIPCAGTD
eukprot:COSAG02_NODE_1620_length_11617_cov_3.185275_2_plen_56_part_00